MEHAALYVEDLEGARVFFEQYFGAVSGPAYHNPRTDFRSYFLSFDGGAHLAFSAGSREEVDRLTERLRQAGYPVLSGPRTTGDGYYESCVAGPEGIPIEITV